MKIVQKVWGEELWIANNELYCSKILRVKKKFRCSYHMHKIKDETFYVQNGYILMRHKDTEFFMDRKSEPLRIFPFEYHSFVVLTDSVEIIEVSTQHFDSDNYRQDESCFIDEKEFLGYISLYRRTQNIYKRR